MSIANAGRIPSMEFKIGDRDYVVNLNGALDFRLQGISEEIAESRKTKNPIGNVSAGARITEAVFGSDTYENFSIPEASEAMTAALAVYTRLANDWRQEETQQKKDAAPATPKTEAE